MFASFMKSLLKHQKYFYFGINQLITFLLYTHQLSQNDKADRAIVTTFFIINNSDG